MKVFKAAKSVISPFLEGIARNFDFAGSIVDFPAPSLKDNELSSAIGGW